MAIQVRTADPQGLLDAIYEAIDEGHIETWTYDEDGDFIHDTPDQQWVGEAWLHPVPGVAMLTLNSVPSAEGLSDEAYAVYHGRFIEMLLAHFDKQFSDASVTALLTPEEQL
jgi:hypothetical protein